MSETHEPPRCLCCGQPAPDSYRVCPATGVTLPPGLLFCRGCYEDGRRRAQRPLTTLLDGRRYQIG